MPGSDSEKINYIRLNLPELPGIYKYLDEEGKIIYVGKARNLKKRVNSYFLKTNGQDFKTKKLVSKIADIQITITSSEHDALLLENNLIKNLQPKFNIMLKDGKTYPFIVIKNERFPRITTARYRNKEGSEYFGPFSNVKAMYSLLELIQKNYKLRSCSFNLNQKNIDEGKFRLCLEFHIGKCLGPCNNLQSEENYIHNIAQIRQILKGNYTQILNGLKLEMKSHAEKHFFEEAQKIKEIIEGIEVFQKSTCVVSDQVSNTEVITLLTEQGIYIANHFKIHQGSIIQTHTFEIYQKMEESLVQVFSAVIDKLIAEEENFGHTILTNLDVNDIELPEFYSVHKPLKGDKARLVQLSEKNSQLILNEKLAQINLRAKIREEHPALIALKNVLSLPNMPSRIECFDNSNLQGTNPVAAMVCFIHAKPAKKEYRHFNIKSVEGIDDFASMAEIVTRRYKKIKEENLDFPDLVIIDGGKGQLSAAVEALKSIDVYGKFPIIGLAKRLEEIFTPGDSESIYIERKSPALKLIQQIRDETHRFAITFHRNKRSKSVFTSELNVINGIGTKTVNKLLLHFKSVKGIKNAKLEELEAVIGKAKAELVLEKLK